MSGIRVLLPTVHDGQGAIVPATTAIINLSPATTPPSRVFNSIIFNSRPSTTSSNFRVEHGSNTFEDPVLCASEESKFKYIWHNFKTKKYLSISGKLTSEQTCWEVHGCVHEFRTPVSPATTERMNDETRHRSRRQTLQVCDSGHQQGSKSATNVCPATKQWIYFRNRGRKYTCWVMLLVSSNLPPTDIPRPQFPQRRLCPL